jgi:hypothetical protein
MAGLVRQAGIAAELFFPAYGSAKIITASGPSTKQPEPGHGGREVVANPPHRLDRRHVRVVGKVAVPQRRLMMVGVAQNATLRAGNPAARPASLPTLPSPNRRCFGGGCWRKIELRRYAVPSRRNRGAARPISRRHSYHLRIAQHIAPAHLNDTSSII